MKKGITRKLVCVLMGVLSTLFLVSCGDAKITGLSVGTSDKLDNLTVEIAKAHNDYIEAAATALSARGVNIANDTVEMSEAGISDFLGKGSVDLANAQLALNDYSKCVLITTGKNREDVTGTMSLWVDDGSDEGISETVAYKFFYGSVDIDDLDTNTDPDYDTIDEGWVLYLDFSDTLAEGGDDATIMDGIADGEWSESSVGVPFVSLDPTDKDNENNCVYVVWEGNPGYEIVELDPTDMPDANPADDAEFYGAYGLDVITMQKGRSGDTRAALWSLLALTSTSTFISPSNRIVGDEAWGGWSGWGSNGETIYIRRPTDNFEIVDADGDGAPDNFSPYTWSGVDINNGTTISTGYEPISSVMVDYGRIYTLKTESAEDIANVQQGLESLFGNDDKKSVIINAGSVSGNALSGSTLINNFEPTEVALVPPGFGILSYSMIPRTKELGSIDLSTDGVGVVYPVGGSGTSDPSLALGFLGPNVKVIDAMNTVLSAGGGGFAIINEKVYLMAYPVSAINYLYTDEETKNTYLGIGPAPVYYNLIYDRLDYKYGPEYQFIGSADTGVSDPELYRDFNFVGGISYRDATTGSYISNGGVGLLLDENNKPLTCKLQIAADKNIDSAKKAFEDIVNNYFVRPVPLYNITDDDGNQISQMVMSAEGDLYPAEDWLRHNIDGKGPIISIINGTAYFIAANDGSDTAMQEYLDGWAGGLHGSYLEVPQFILLNYVESTLLPGAAGQSNVAVTGRRIHLCIDAINFDENTHLFYYKGSTSTKIGEYTSSDNSMKIADLYLGDVVDVRSLCGAGYTKQYCEDGEDPDFTAVQPPYGYNALFPIGVNVVDFVARYEGEEKSRLDPDVAAWVDDNVGDTPDIQDFYTMSHWNGNETSLKLKENRNYTSQSDYTIYYTGIGDTYYQSASVVTNVASLTHTVVDGTGSDGQAATSIVASLAISGAEPNVHLGETSVTTDTLIEDLPYVPTNIITFSEPFPNTLFETADTETIFNAGSQAGTDTAMPNVMFTIAVGTGITKGNFFNAWVISDAPTDSLNWWNNYLSAHNYTYNVKAQTVRSYIETNYSYLANEANRLRVDLNSVEYWSETLDVTNPSHGGNFISNIIMTASNIVGVFCVFYSIICLLLWAVDIYAGFDKDFYRMVTGGRYIASAERLAPVGKTIYATFPNALGRSTVIFVAGLVLIFVGAGTLLALMFRFVAVILRIIFRYWN